MKKGRHNTQHSMQGAFVFVLLGLFAMMSTLMVLLGAQMYHGVVERSMDNNQDRVLAAYVRSMIRAEDIRGGVAVERYDALPWNGEADAGDGDDGLVDFGDDGMVDFADDGMVDFGNEQPAAFGGDGLVDFGDDGMVDFGSEQPAAFGGDGLVDFADAGSSAEAADTGFRWVLRQPGAQAPEGMADTVCAVAMTESIDGRDYVTWIYEYEGQLRELFTDRGNAFQPNHGTVVCPVQAMAATLDNGLLILRMQDEDDVLRTVQVALHGGG